MQKVVVSVQELMDMLDHASEGDHSMSITLLVDGPVMTLTADDTVPARMLEMVELHTLPSQED